VDGEECLWLVGLVVVFAVTLSILRKRGEEMRREAWRELAGRTGLTFESRPGKLFRKGSMSVAGTYRGRHLKLDTHQVQEPPSGEYDQGVTYTFTRTTISVNAPPEAELSLSAKFILGGGELVGDKQFDRQFVIKSQPKGLAAKVFASPELRQHAFQTRSTKFKLAHRELIWSKSDVEPDVEYLHSVFDLLCDVAEAVERAVQDTGD